MNHLENAWFNWLLISTGVVAVGLLFELPEIWHDSVNAIRELRLSPSQHREVSARVKLLVSVGWLLIVIGVVGEFVADSFVSKADGIVTTFNETLLADAQRKTGLASERAASAFARAAQTEREASQENERAANAEKQAQQENERAAKALEAAEEARQEAEGFRLQIAQANERAAKSELELAQIKSPRSLTRVSELVTKLSAFSGTEYMFLSVAADDESITLLRQIDDALQQSGWKRAQPYGPYPPSIRAWGAEVNMAVTQALTTGIEISIESRESVSSLNAVPESERPPLVKAAETLNAGLAGSLSPSQENLGKTLRIEPGDGKFVRIAVGRKPM